MQLKPPNLDDRTFDKLLEEALQRVQRSCPDWTDLSVGDPGRVLLELFAYLTETMIYRLNRIPEKAYIEFLRLIGVRLHPPASAGVMLGFTRSRATDKPLEIPRGTRVSATRSSGSGQLPIFTTAKDLVIPANETRAEVLAYHCELVKAELLGVSTGMPGQSFRIKTPPIIAPTGDELDLVVGVEVGQDELEEDADVIVYQDRNYRIWHEADNFTGLGLARHVYIADRYAGIITFAPSAQITKEDGALSEVPQALAEIPATGKEIRIWYRHGGGPDGNVARNILTVLKDPIPGIEVTNPEPAVGGREAESIQNALIRGPQELHSLQRAVTARDFELITLQNSRAVVRAKAFTQAALWSYAFPGTVEVILVPYLPGKEYETGYVTSAMLREYETEVARSQIKEILEERRPLGTTCVVNWARYKTVKVKARIVVSLAEDLSAVRERVIKRLNQTINPLPTLLRPSGWPFGQTLRASHVYDTALAEPGVLWADSVRLCVENVPAQGVNFLEKDYFQPRAWYAGSGSMLFRTLDNGDGWEVVGNFPDENVRLVYANPDHAGLLAVVTNLPANEGSRIYISRDCGESWDPSPFTTSFEINDVAWMSRGDVPVVLLATEAGLYELSLLAGSSPVQVLVDRDDQHMGFYAVTASKDVRGQVCLALASEGTRGVYLSSEGGRPNTFRHIGLKGHDVRILAVQYDGIRSYLWAGVAAEGGDPGKGCFRWELRGHEDPPEGWLHFGADWKGGSCLGLAFLGTKVVAATHRSGVLSIKSGEREPKWQEPDVRCGLPMRDPGRFQTVHTAAADSNTRIIMAGGIEGVFRSKDEGIRYESCSSSEFSDKVTLPPNWLFCSAEHDIVVEREDEAERD